MDRFILDLCILLAGSAVLSCCAVYLKQPVIIAYILCGMLAGPGGLGWIKETEFIEGISHIGITLLLFLAGLCLHPQKLIELFRKTFWVTLANCVCSFALAFLSSRVFGFSVTDSACIGLALMFSSTILTLKLMPTTTLHQQRMGALCISVLILQDMIAVGVLILIRCLNSSQGILLTFGLTIVKLSALLVILGLLEHFVLRKILSSVDRIQEAVFVIGLAWCIGIATIFHYFGLFYETGAFFAGVVLARHKISLFISEKLKPLRDFFLILFFFSLGASLDILVIIKEILFPGIVLAALFLLLKPWIFKTVFAASGETKEFSGELGMRLGQLSEFSLLIALLAFELGQISGLAFQFIQLVTILTIIVSSYLVAVRFPTPIGNSERLFRD